MATPAVRREGKRSTALRPAREGRGRGGDNRSYVFRGGKKPEPCVSPRVKNNRIKNPDRKGGTKGKSDKEENNDLHSYMGVTMVQGDDECQTASLRQ